MPASCIVKWLWSWSLDVIAMFILLISIIPEYPDIPVHSYGNEKIIKIFFIGLKHKMIQSSAGII